MGLGQKPVVIFEFNAKGIFWLSSLCVPPTWVPFSIFTFFFSLIYCPMFWREYFGQPTHSIALFCPLIWSSHQYQEGIGFRWNFFNNLLRYKSSNIQGCNQPSISWDSATLSSINCRTKIFRTEHVQTLILSLFSD
jgi:hypothetical protein